MSEPTTPHSECISCPTENLSDFSFAFNNADHSNRTLTIFYSPSDLLADQVSPKESKSSSLVPAEAEVTSPKRFKKTLFVNTAILGKESEYFRAYFSSGFVETWQISDARDPKGIHVQDLQLFYVLLQAIYSGGQLAPDVCNDSNFLLRLLMLSDEFRCSSVLASCARALQRAPMTWHLSLAVLTLPHHIRECEPSRGLVSSARRFLEKTCPDLDAQFSSHDTDFWKLPLQAVECLLASPRVKVQSEDSIFFAVLQWASKNMPRGSNGDEGIFELTGGSTRGVALRRLWSLVRLPQMSSECLLSIRRFPDASLWIEPEKVDEAIRIKMMDPRGVGLLYGSSVPYVARPGKRPGPALLTWTLSEKEIVDLGSSEVKESTERVFVCGNWYCAELRKTRPGTLYDNSVQIRLVDRETGPVDHPFVSIKGKRVIEASCTVGTPSKSRVNKGPCQLVCFGEGVSKSGMSPTKASMDNMLNPNPNPNIGELTVGSKMWGVNVREVNSNLGPKLNELTYDLLTQRYTHPAVGSVFDELGNLQITIAFQLLSSCV